MDQTLVIVTCLKDSWQFELLCNTMTKFLKPCPILIITNEDEYWSRVWKKWFDVAIAKKLSNFDITIKSRNDFLSLEYNVPGWFTQQILKLSAYKYVKTDSYVLLDSKNFLTQPIYINEIKQRRPTFININDGSYNFILETYKHFNVVPPAHIYLTQNITPFVINKDIAASLINHFGDVDRTFQFMLKTSFAPDHTGLAEFYLYGVYEQIVSPVDDSLYGSDIVVVIDRTNVSMPHSSSDSKIFGLHRHLFYNLDDSDLYNLLYKLDCSDCIPEGPSPSNRSDIPPKLYFNNHTKG